VDQRLLNFVSNAKGIVVENAIIAVQKIFATDV